MKVLIDHNISHYLAHALNAVVWPSLGDSVVAKRDKFAENTDDAKWIGGLGREGGWTVITKDDRIRRSAIERAAFRQAGLVGFVLAPSLQKSPTIELTARLLLQWRRIAQQVALVEGGAMFELRAPGGRFRSLPL